MTTSVFELFEKLDREGFSGEVEVTSSQGHATVLMKEGKFIWAHRPVDRAIERFQKISWVKLPDPDLLATVRTWSQFVSVLLSENPDQFARIVRLLKMDRLEVFFRIFFWSNIELHPREAQIGTLEGQLGFYSVRQFDRLLIEAQRRVDEWPQMRQKMGSSRRIFISQVEPASLKAGYEASEDSYGPGGEQAGTPLPHLPFSSEEIEILKLCDGRNAVQDLVRILPDGEFLVVQRLLDLWRKGAVRPKDDEESVVSVFTRPEDVSFRDILASIWISAAVCFIFFAALRLSPTAKGSSDIPVEVFQSLEVYRKVEGHYPLTLSELPQHMVRSELIKDLEYALSDPAHYELKRKIAH